MSFPDFSAVHLLPEEEAALRRYAALDQIPEDAPYLKTFRRYGFLSRVDTVQDDMGFPGGGRLIVSDHGRRFLHYLEDKDKQRRWDHRLAVAALAVSIGSLIVSVIALLKP